MVPLFVVFVFVSASLQHEKARFLIRFYTWFHYKLSAPFHRGRLLRFRLFMFASSTICGMALYKLHFEVRILCCWQFWKSLFFSVEVCWKKKLRKLNQLKSCVPMRGWNVERGFDVFFLFTKYNLFNKINNPHTKHLTRFRFILFFPSFLRWYFVYLFFVSASNYSTNKRKYCCWWFGW